jgi:predicted acylesterase/phospholipase RssA
MAVRGAGTVALPSLKETLSRAMSIGSVDAVAVARKKAEVLIEPETGSVGMFEFKEMDRLIAAGRRAALVALEQGFDRIVDPPPS